MNNYSSILNKIEHAKELDFGDILSRSIELFKKGWVQGFLLILIVVLMALPFLFVIYMPLYQMVVEQTQNGSLDPNMVNEFVYNDSFRYKVLGITFIISFLNTILIAGFYRIIKKLDFSESQSFSDLFYFFKGKYLGKIFAIAAFTLLIALINHGLEKFLPSVLSSMLTMVLTIVSSVYTTLFVVVFAFNPDLESSEIFNLAFKLGTKKWGIILGLLIVSGIIACLGAIACGFGILFTLAIVYFPQYLVYKDIVGFKDIDGIDQIGVREGEDN